MSESYIQVAPDSTGKLMRAILRTVGLNSVYDEVIELSDQSGVLITPLAERDLVLDQVVGSALKGLPIIGWDLTLLGPSLLPLANGTVPVSGFVGINGALPAGLLGASSSTTNIASNGGIAAFGPILVTNPSGYEAVQPVVEVLGTWVGTLTFEVQSGSLVWYVVAAKNIITGVIGTTIANTATDGLYLFPSVTGAIAWRVRATAWTSGTANITFSGAPFSNPVPLWATKTATGGLPPEAVYIGGTDGTNLRGISIKNTNPLTTDYGAFIRTLFQQLPGSAIPSHAAYIGGTDGTNLQPLGINASNQAAIQNPPNLDAAISTLLANAKFPTTAALADGTANPTLTEIQTFPMGFNGATWDRLKAGTVSVGDSSTALLGIGGVFTGAYENVKDYGAITISVFTDQASAANGLEFDWSHDGVNTDSSSTTNVAASSGRAFSISPRARFFRVVYTNGAVAQGVFRLGVVYHPTGSGLISRPFSQTLDQDNYAQQVRAVLDGFDGTLFRHVGATLSQPLATDYGVVTRGLVYRNPLTGLYYAESGNITVLATAHTALQGFIWLVNTSSTIKAYIRSIGFVWSGTAATAFPTSPRITVERVTFTGTPSGATITPAKRASADAANTATLRTASTGLTLTAGAVIESFVVGSILTAVGAVSVPEESWQPTDDDALIVLGQNEGIVIRQPDAGTAADTRKIVMTLSWEER